MKFLGIRKIGLAALSVVALIACEAPKNGDISAPTPSSAASPSSEPRAAMSPSEQDGAKRPGASDALAAQERAPDPAHRQVAVLAGGCFWGMEDILRDIPGVIETDVGYSGGTMANPGYGDVKKGNTGHAESVRIVFDPSRISYSELLEKWFFRMHDPTTKNRQGNDVGSQYRSAIFYNSEAQRETALTVIERVDDSKQWDEPIVTEVAPFSEFTPAEGYHQDYLEKNPGGYTCHYMRDSTL